ISYSLDHRPKPFIRNAVTVVRGHRIIDVSHDGIDGHLILGFPGLGFKAMAERIKPQSAPPLDLELLEQFSELRRQRVDRDSNFVAWLVTSGCAGFGI